MLIHNLSRRLGAITVLAGALLVAPLAVAAQANTPATHSSAACSAGWFGNRPYCIDGVATVLAKNTAACQGDQQYYPSRDGADVPINWTYANGTNACVRVRYNPPGDDATCDYWFYVPQGMATAKIAFGIWDKYGSPKRYSSLDENANYGWTLAFRGKGVNRIEFQDNNGQGYPSQIGWGQQNYGFWIDSCS